MCADNLCQRPPDMVNPSMPTGEVEVVLDKLEVVNKAESLPFDLRAAENVEYLTVGADSDSDSRGGAFEVQILGLEVA